MVLFILNHLHILLAVLSLVVLVSRMALKTKAIILAMLVAVQLFLMTQSLQFINNPAPKAQVLHYDGVEFEANDIVKMPVLNQTERDERTKELLDFQDKFDKILKD